MGATVAVVIVLMIPSIYSFEPERGFYAEYEMYEDPEFPYPTTAFALLREHREWEIKYLDIEDLVYKYQVLDIRQNKALVRICFQGIATIGWYSRKSAFFKRVFDVTIDLNTLEMIDENGNAWGKWLFWIKLGSYDWRKYTMMKNWNGHGEVTVWIEGPYENDYLFSILHSSYIKTTTDFFKIETLKVEDYTVKYPVFEEYDIMTSYKDYKTPEGTIRSEEPGGYYLSEIEVGFDTGEEVELKSGLNMTAFYMDNGLLLEIFGDYIDDFLDQKIGIVLLQTDFLILTNYGVSDDILIDEPTPETQRTSFEKEIEQMLGRSPKDSEGTVTTEVPSNPPETQITESPQPPQEKSETPTPTTTQSQEDTENNTMLYYVAPLLIVMIVAVFVVLREKR